MDHGHVHGMMMGPPSPSPSSYNATVAPRHHNMMMMHMTFYWGKNAEILFTGWPGTSPAMYALSLLVVFLLAVIIEWLSRAASGLVLAANSPNNDVVSGLVKTLLHALRMGIAYIVMLAVMSFNAGILIAAVAGHAFGFLVFGTWVFRSRRKSPQDDIEKPNGSELPPMSC